LAIRIEVFIIRLSPEYDELISDAPYPTTMEVKVQKVTPPDLMALMRNRYQGTDYDMTTGRPEFCLFACLLACFFVCLFVCLCLRFFFFFVCLLFFCAVAAAAAVGSYSQSVLNPRRPVALLWPLPVA
jgi:hypothetical protein